MRRKFRRLSSTLRKARDISALSQQILSWIDSIRKSSVIQNVLRVLIIGGAILVSGGMIFVWFHSTVAFATVPTLTLILRGLDSQSYSEVIVVSTYYAMATVGFISYIIALKGGRDPRVTKYLFIASVVLIAVAIIGIDLALRSKIGR